MRDNFKPREVKREHGVEWTGDASQRDRAAYTCRHSAKYHPEYEKGERALCWEVLFIIYLDLFPSCMWRSQFFFSPMRRKTKTQYFWKSKPMGYKERNSHAHFQPGDAKLKVLPMFLQGLWALQCSRPCPNLRGKKSGKNNRVTRTLNVALTFGLTNLPIICGGTFALTFTYPDTDNFISLGNYKVEGSKRNPKENMEQNNKQLCRTSGPDPNPWEPISDDTSKGAELFHPEIRLFVSFCPYVSFSCATSLCKTGSKQIWRCSTAASPKL